MIILIICEKVADKYVFHEYGTKSEHLSINSVDRLKETLEKDFLNKEILFIMLTAMKNPFNFNQEVKDHGKAN